MELLELFDQIAKSGDGGESDRWIAAVYRVVEFGEVSHTVSLS